jgi:hypothetical protein
MPRSPLTALAAGVTTLSSLALAPTAAHADPFPNALIRTNLTAVDRCFGPSNGGNANGTPIVLMDCNQSWHGKSLGSGIDTSVRSFSGKCFTMQPGHPVPAPIGTPLVLQDCGSPVTGDQQWNFVAVNPPGLDNLWVLVNRPSLRCAVPQGGSSALGTRLVMADCTFRVDQRWLTQDKPRTFGFGEEDGDF